MTASAAGAPAPRPSRDAAVARRVALWLLQTGLVLVVLIAVWEVATVHSESIFFPPPSEIVARMQELWFSGSPPLFLTDAVSEDVLPSLGRMFAGLGIAACLGIALGAVVGRSQAASEGVLPSIHFMRSIPGPALLPVFLILFGTDDSMRVSLIAFGTIWPILLNTMDGVRTIDPVQLETARALGLGPWARLRKVVLRAAMPKIFAGLRIAIALAIILMVVSELVAATDGIGHMMLDAQRRYLLTDMWAGILLLSILGLLLNLIFEAMERHFLRWHHASHRWN